MNRFSPFHFVLTLLFLVTLLFIVYYVLQYFVLMESKAASAEAGQAVVEEKIVYVPVEPERTDLDADKNEMYESDAQLVEKWNQIALEIIAGTQLNPPEASRFLAIMHIAMFEAVNSIDRNYEPYTSYLETEETKVYDKPAVVAFAAKEVIDDFHPSFKMLTEHEVKDYAEGYEDSRELAVESAQQILTARASDGAKGKRDYAIVDEVGKWHATPPYYQSPLLPHWGDVELFSETSEAHYPDQPDALESETYVRDYEEVKKLGGVNSETRTEDQSEIAKFWADGKGTYTPPGHWNLISQHTISEDPAQTIEEEARCYALLNIAMADAGIKTWKAKFDYEYWRPIDAITKADADSNELTVEDEGWFNFIETPNFPEYPSGHSTFSGAGATILAAMVGDDTAFETHSLGLPGVTRSFDSFSEAANEAGMSRIYGGIHFQKANTEGLALGRKIATDILNNLLLEVDES